MANASLSPAFFRLFYTVANLPHVQTVPMQDWSEPSGGHDWGTFKTWNNDQIDADDLIQAFAALLAPIYTEDCNLDQYIIYTQATATATPFPRVQNVIDIPGTNVSAEWFQAVQTTVTWRDVEFHKFKIVLLEAPTDGTYGKLASLPGSGAYFNLNAEITSADKPYSSRWGKRPATFLSVTETLNEKLRRERRLT